MSKRLQRFIKAGGRVKLLFGDDFGISQSEALRRLHRMGVSLRLFVGEGQVSYHPKMWIFQGSDRLTSLTGSSNLSKPALTKSVEANILLDGSEDVIMQQIRYFDNLWENYSFKKIDREWIDHYVDVERSLGADVKYRTDGSINQIANCRQVTNFIDGWMRHIGTGKKRGLFERWRGWYIFPEPASINDARMLEFKNVILAIRASRQYTKYGSATLSVNYVNRILRAARIRYKGHGRMTLSPKGRRDLFIRQHKNYLDRLGFISIVDEKGPKIAITRLGLALSRSSNSRQRKRLYTRALRQIRWAWAPKLKLLDFLVRLLDRLPSRRLYYHELSYLVIHAEHNLMFGPVLSLTRIMRSLPNSMRSRLITTCERKLKSRLGRKSMWAYYRYQRKIRELMALLGYAEGIRYLASDADTAKYITLA